MQAAKTNGMFKAGDWQCGTCGNTNWEKRSKCNVCQALKFPVIEERAGLGGGFKENSNVQYRRTETDER